MILDRDGNWDSMELATGYRIFFCSTKSRHFFLSHFSVLTTLLGTSTSISDCALTPLVNILSTSLVKIYYLECFALFHDILSSMTFTII